LFSKGVTEIAKQINDVEAAHQSTEISGSPIHEKSAHQVHEKPTTEVQETTTDGAEYAAKEEKEREREREAKDEKNYDGIEHAENKM